MIEIQYNDTALLLLVNPHWNNATYVHIYCLKRRRFIVSYSCMFNPLYNSTNQQLFKKNFWNQSSNYENYSDFRYEWKPSCAYHKIDTFRGKQKWMGHKKGHW